MSERYKESEKGRF